jgi:uncharacterized protein YaiL (DUF2058 family)
MKTNLIKTAILGTAFLLAGSAFAQGPGQRPPRPAEKGHLQGQDKKEDIDAMKIAYITKELSLTPEEAQLFWPVYNQYNDKLQDLRKKRMDNARQTKDNVDKMTDKEVEQSIDNDLISRQKELDLRKEYAAKFKAILPVKKIAKLYQAEEQFKRVLLNKLKDHPDGPPSPPAQKE